MFDGVPNVVLMSWVKALLVKVVRSGVSSHSEVIWIVEGDWTCVPIVRCRGPSGVPMRALNFSIVSLGIVAGS